MKNLVFILFYFKIDSLEKVEDSKYFLIFFWFYFV